jgi:hypothetical protein
MVEAVLQNTPLPRRDGMRRTSLSRQAAIRNRAAFTSGHEFTRAETNLDKIKRRGFSLAMHSQF